MQQIEYNNELVFIIDNFFSKKRSLEESVSNLQQLLVDILKTMSTSKHGQNYAYLDKYKKTMEPFVNFLKLNYSSSHQYLKSLEGILELLDVKAEGCDDEWHDKKRRTSFTLLDSFLNDCKKGKCPVLDEEHIYYLSDISIDCFIEERAYYYYDRGEGVDKDNQYYLACEKIQQVFICQKNKCDICLQVFEKDINDINSIYQYSTKNRKAFWRHKANEKLNKRDDPKYNYEGACGFVTKMSIYNNERNSEKYKEIIMNNFDIANGLDLFRFCSIKRHLT